MSKSVLYFLAFAHFCNDVGSGALPATLPYLADAYGFAYTDIAGLMFASSFLSSFIQPIFGWIADRTEKGRLIGCGVLLSLGAFGCVGYFQDYKLLFAAITLMGIGAAAFHPEATRLVNVLSANHPGIGVSIFSVGGNAGFGIGPLLAVFFISMWGLAGLRFFSVFGVIFAAILFLTIPRLKKQAASILIQRNDAAKKAGTFKNDWHSFLRLTAVIMLRSTVITGLSSFLPLYCIRALGASNAMGSSTLSIFAMLGIITTLIGGRIADKIGFAKTMRYGCLAMIPVLGLMVFGHNLTLIYALLLPLSFAIHGVYSPLVVLGQSYLTKNIGFASGITMGVSFSVGGILVPFLGMFADNHGLDTTMQLIFAISVLCGLGSIFLKEPQKAAA